MQNRDGMQKKCLRSKIDHISANSKQNSKRLLPVNQGPRGYYLMKQTEGRKSRDTVPLTMVLLFSYLPLLYLVPLKRVACPSAVAAKNKTTTTKVADAMIVQ
jgi:hypothetical protein